MFREIQRQSTSFAYRMSSDHEEWRGARDFDYDDGRPSRIDLAQEQAEDEFWEEKERDYPRGYGPPQTGDEDHDHPGWLYVDDEAPIPDEVTDADLVEDDDFDPYEDEIGDGPLDFDTPIYHPGGGYDDYDKTLNLIEEQEGSGPDIEKFSATEEFDCDGIHNWGPNERCEDCGKEDTREPGDEKPIGKLPKKEGRNPFDRRVAGKTILYHLTDSPEFLLDNNFEPEAALDIPGMRIQQPGVYLTSDPKYWIDQHGYWRPYTAEFEVSDPLAGREKYERENGSYPEVFVPSRMFDQITLKGVRPTSFPPPRRKRSQRLAWGDNAPPPPRKPKEPEKAIRNDDVKIMRDSETGLGYDAIVKVNDKGGYDVIKILGRQRYSAKAGDTFQHKHFRENVPGVKIKDQPFMQMKVTRTDPHTVWYSAADGKGSWRMDRAEFEKEYGENF